MKHLWGYYIYQIDKSYLLPLYNACLLGDIPLSADEREDKVIVILPWYRKKGFEKALAQREIPYERSVLKGVLGGVVSLAKHPGVLVGLVLSIVLYIWLGSMVWEVRVKSSQDIDEDDILAKLTESGLYEGAWIWELDEDEIVSKYLLLDPSISFATVHLNGVVATVEVIKKEVDDSVENQAPPCNVVASSSALVTGVTVYSGKAVVKVGDTVKEGDLLVSGIVTDVGGTRIVSARADVEGILHTSLHIEVPSTQSVVKVDKGKQRAVTIRFFGIPITLGSVAENAIVNERQLYLFDRVRLPIYVKTYYEKNTETYEVVYTQEECVRMAEAKAKQMLATTLGDGDLITYEEEKIWDGKTLVLQVNIEYEGNIGKSLAFEADN